MTNAEKFEEVFGIKIDEFPAGICDIVDHSICIDAKSCVKCKLYHFWEKQYRKKNKKED